MEKNNITVVVSGAANTGKSTISKIVIDILREKGFNVEVADEMLFDHQGSEARFHANMNKFADKRIDSVIKKSKITVTEKQLHRSHF